MDAHAILSGVLYAYRHCTEHCFDGDSAHHEEEIVLFGPPAIWVGTSDEPGKQQIDADQPFSTVSARLHPGGSLSLIVVAADTVVDAFRRNVDVNAHPPDGPVVPTWTTFTLDVVWPFGSSIDANLFVARGQAPPATIGGPPSYSSGFDISENPRPGCAALAPPIFEPIR